MACFFSNKQHNKQQSTLKGQVTSMIYLCLIVLVLRWIHSRHVSSTRLTLHRRACRTNNNQPSRGPDNKQPDQGKNLSLHSFGGSTLSKAKWKLYLYNVYIYNVLDLLLYFLSMLLFKTSNTTNNNQPWRGKLLQWSIIAISYWAWTEFFLDKSLRL